MITIKEIKELARNMARDEGISVPSTFDAKQILTELGETQFEVGEDWDFLHEYGHELCVLVSRQLGI